MKITHQTPTVLNISGLTDLDPITVCLFDLAPSAGKIIVQCYDRAWSIYFGAMGEDRNIVDFILQANTGYLVGKVTPSVPMSIPDFNALGEMALAVLDRHVSEGATLEVDDHSARTRLRSMYSEADAAEASEILSGILGHDWHYDIPNRLNPEHTYVARIIDAVKAALNDEFRAGDKHE